MIEPMSEPDDLTAAEFALGLLDGAEREAARSRVASDVAFAAAVDAWSQRLAPMLDEFTPVTPPEALRDRLLRQAAISITANDPLPMVQRQLARWRAGAGVASALAAGFALLLLVRPEPIAAPPQPTAPTTVTAPLVAALATPKKTPAMIASYDGSAHTLVVAGPTALPDRPGGDYELWVIPAGQKPVSLGVMPAAAPLRRHLSDQLAALMVRGAALAVTPETRGGSPTGQPQGTPIASGALA